MATTKKTKAVKKAAPKAKAAPKSTDLRRRKKPNSSVSVGVGNKR